MKTRRGFTLIETIIYIALLAFIMGGALSATYSIIENVGRLDANVAIQEEGNFVLRKINWALSSVQTINVPNGSNYGSALSIGRYGGMTVDICFKNQIIWIRENGSGGTCGDSSYASTTTSNVKVSALQFYHATNPVGIEASTTINNVVFSITKYVRN